MITNGNCTVINRVYNPDRRMDEWVTTHLFGVFWENTKGMSVVKSGAKEADGVRVFIPFGIKSDKVYKAPKAFEKAPNGFFTLRPEDILIYGVVSDITNIAKLQNEYDDVMTITEVNRMNFGSPRMQHWEVSGK